MASFFSREDDIDNDVLIEEVEKRPALYEKKLKEYSDSNLKIKAWEEISKIIYSNAWGNFSQQEKTEAGKLVQKRWQNLRSSFSRELREQKSSKSGQASSKRRKYKHFDQLLFLVPSMDTRETSGNAKDIDCEEVSSVDEDVPQRSQYSRKRKSNTASYEDRLLDILDKKRVDDNKLIEAMRNKKSNSDDDDMEKHFALSLVPLLKAVPEENKLEVQIKILQIFQDVQKKNSQSAQQNYSPILSSSASYIGSPQNFRIVPKCSVSVPQSSPQNQLKITGSQPNSAPTPIYIPATRLQNFRILPKYSLSLPQPSPQNQLKITGSQPNSAPTPTCLPPPQPSSQSHIHLPTQSKSYNYQNPSTSHLLHSSSLSVQSHVSESAEDSEDSEIYDICQENNFTTEKSLNQKN